MNVLFLDHDGVICLPDNWGTRHLKFRYGIDNVFDDFSEEAVNVLNEIIQETDCEIVISSDWRHHASLKEMQEMYLSRKIIKAPIDVTGHVRYTSAYKLEDNRIEEILNWIDTNRVKYNISKWVAVDDMNLGNSATRELALHNFVRTNAMNGLCEPDIKYKIIDFLK